MDEELLSYAWERKFFMAVSEGNVDEVKMRGNPSLVGHCSKMVQCELKRIEYEICTGLSLGCRAMIEGGIEPSAAYSLRDSYLRRLELCKTGNEMIALSVESFVCFTTLVHENKKKRSIPLTDIVKHYIEANIMDNWTLDDIAQGIAINKSYLCHVFKKSEGMTVMAYTRQKRLEAAASLLRKSTAPIASIAAELCFADQAHFGRLFKKQFGITPKQYRKNVGNIALSTA